MPPAAIKRETPIVAQMSTPNIEQQNINRAHPIKPAYHRSKGFRYICSCLDCATLIVLLGSFASLIVIGYGTVGIKDRDQFTTTILDKTCVATNPGNNTTLSDFGLINPASSASSRRKLQGIQVANYTVPVLISLPSDPADHIFDSVGFDFVFNASITFAVDYNDLDDQQLSLSLALLGDMFMQIGYPQLQQKGCNVLSPGTDSKCLSLNKYGKANKTFTNGPVFFNSFNEISINGKVGGDMNFTLSGLGAFFNTDGDNSAITPRLYKNLNEEASFFIHMYTENTVELKSKDNNFVSEFINIINPHATVALEVGVLMALIENEFAYKLQIAVTTIEGVAQPQFNKFVMSNVANSSSKLQTYVDRTMPIFTCRACNLRPYVSTNGALLTTLGHVIENKISNWTDDVQKEISIAKRKIQSDASKIVDEIDHGIHTVEDIAQKDILNPISKWFRRIFK